MPKAVLTTVLLLILASAGCFAQSNDRIDELLAQEEAEFGHSIYLLLSASGHIDEDVSVAAAYEAYSELGWRLSAKPIDASISIRELSYIIMKSLDLPGGIMYSLFPSPRYAHRELVYDGLISGQIPAESIVSGEQVIRFVGAVIRSREAQ